MQQLLHQILLHNLLGCYGEQSYQCCSLVQSSFHLASFSVVVEAVYRCSKGRQRHLAVKRLPLLLLFGITVGFGLGCQILNHKRE